MRILLMYLSMSFVCLFAQTPSTDYGICNTIKIKYEQGQSFTYNADKNTLKSDENKENFSIIIKGLNTKTPEVQGNNPTFPNSTLFYMGGDIVKETFYLMELNGFKNIFLITIFPNQKKVIFHKQYPHLKPIFDNSGFYATMLYGSYTCL